MTSDMEPTDKIVNEHTGTQYTVAEIEHSRRIQKSVTPKGTLDWYLKWIGSLIVLVAVAFRSSGVPELQIYDVILSWIGAVLWFMVGFLWKDRAIMILHAVLGIMLFTAILREFFA